MVTYYVYTPHPTWTKVRVTEPTTVSRSRYEKKRSASRRSFANYVILSVLVLISFTVSFVGFNQCISEIW